MVSHYYKVLIGILCIAVLSGCGAFSKSERRAEYKKSTSVPSLELPPDLSRAAITDPFAVPDLAGGDNMARSNEANYQGSLIQNAPYAGQTSDVLPATEAVVVKKSGDVRWLVVQAPPEMIWSTIEGFWQDAGFELAQVEPKIGLIETEWAENRADIPEDGIRRLLRNVVDFAYSAPTRDKFRVRVERGAEPNTSEIYLSHQGVKQVSRGEFYIWEARPADPELEAEMLNRLLVFIGFDQQQSENLIAEAEPRPSRADLNKGRAGEVRLLVKNDFDQAWQLTGVALDRVGFTVEDRDRSQGLYFVRYMSESHQEKKGGFFSRLFGRDDRPAGEGAEYSISLIEQNPTVTLVTVLNSQGDTDSSETAEQILTLLHEQLK